MHTTKSKTDNGYNYKMLSVLVKIIILVTSCIRYMNSGRSWIHARASRWRHIAVYQNCIIVFWRLMTLVQIMFNKESAIC